MARKPKGAPRPLDKAAAYSLQQGKRLKGWTLNKVNAIKARRAAKAQETNSR